MPDYKWCESTIINIFPRTQTRVVTLAAQEASGTLATCSRAVKPHGRRPSQLQRNIKSATHNDDQWTPEESGKRNTPSHGKHRPRLTPPLFLLPTALLRSALWQFADWSTYKYKQAYITATNRANEIVSLVKGSSFFCCCCAVQHESPPYSPCV